jgi:hypothetical protein
VFCEAVIEPSVHTLCLSLSLSLSKYSTGAGFREANPVKMSAPPPPHPPFLKLEGSFLNFLPFRFSRGYVANSCGKNVRGGRGWPGYILCFGV